MGFFGLTKDKKKDSKKEHQEKKEKFEAGPNGLIFRAEIQVIASPKGYAAEVSQKYFEAIKDNKDAKQRRNYFIIKSNITKPELIPDEDKDKTDVKETTVDIYKVTISLEIGIKDKSKIFDFCFDYMPFLIEVIEPMNLSFNASEFNEYLMNIQATVHKIDDGLKQMNARYQLLQKDNKIYHDSMVRMIKNNVLLSLDIKNQTMPEISKKVGIAEKNLEKFINEMITDKEIKLEKNKYVRIKKKSK